MKTSIKITLCLVWLSFAGADVFAQRRPKYDPLPYSHFAPDTAAYLRNRFGAGRGYHYYHGRTVKELLDELEIPIRATRLRMSPNMWFLHLYVQSPEELEKSDSKRPSITILLQDAIAPPESDLFRGLMDKYEARYEPFEESFRKTIEPLVIYMAYHSHFLLRNEKEEFLASSPLDTTHHNVVPPTFRGGDSGDFRNWFMTKLRYPDYLYPEVVRGHLVQKGLQGIVVTEFLIGLDGKIEDIQTWSPMHSGFHQAARSVVHSSRNDWTPGVRDDGVPVRISFTVPIQFVIPPELSELLREQRRQAVVSGKSQSRATP